jgi:hypothetical protein
MSRFRGSMQRGRLSGRLFLFRGTVRLQGQRRERGKNKVKYAAAALLLAGAAHAEVADNARYDCQDTHVIVSGFRSLGTGLGPPPMPVFSLKLIANSGPELDFNWPSVTFNADTRTLVAKMDSGRQFSVAMSADWKTATVIRRAPTGEIEGNETCPMNGAW